MPETVFPTYEYDIKINTTAILLKVIEYLELTLEKCESSVIIRPAKEFSITVYRVHYLVHKTSLRAPACFSGFGGLGVSVLASGTQVRGFKPGRSRRIFKGAKILSTPSFGRAVKPWVPCRRFAACKRTLNVTWKSAFRQNSRSYSPPISSNFRR
jgi:hypothetical protein